MNLYVIEFRLTETDPWHPRLGDGKPDVYLDSARADARHKALAGGFMSVDRYRVAMYLPTHPDYAALRAVAK